MNTHTPGPWQIVGSSVYGNNLRSLLPANGADARLIAAAPELLAEVARLTAIVESIELPDRSTPDTARARALLNRLGVEA